jgi:hypothetical protein
MLPVPPSTPPGAASPHEEQGAPANHLADHPAEATRTHAGRRTKEPLNSEEMDLLMAFFELLQEWDEDRRIV